MHLQANIIKSYGYSISNRVFSIQKYFSRSVSILEMLYRLSRPQTAKSYLVSLRKKKFKYQSYCLDTEIVLDKTKPLSKASINRLFCEDIEPN